MVETQINGVKWDFEYLSSLKESNLKSAPSPSIFEVNGKPWERTSEPCPRCGGSGRYPSREWQGMCLKCQGAGYIITKHRILSDKEKAQRERAKARRDKRAQEKTKAHEEAHKAYLEKKKAQEEAKALEKAEKLAKLHWVGTVGQKIELTLTLQTCKVYENSYGRTCLFQVMSTPEGDKVIYSGTKDLFPEGVKTITQTFKIKSHEEDPNWGKSTKVSLR